MRSILTCPVLIFLILALPAPTHAQTKGYDASYYASSSWPGEWPNGFSVARRGIVVMGQVEIDPGATPTIACELPFKATIHPWNQARNQRSGIEFRSFQKIGVARATKSFTVKSDGGQTLAIKRGQKVEFLQDGAEGGFTARLNGKEFFADGENFDTSAQANLPNHEWVRIKCVDERYAWIFVDELNPKGKDGAPKYRDGLWAADGGSAAVPDFGKARDLTDADVKRGNKRD